MMHLEKNAWRMRVDTDSTGIRDSWFNVSLDRSSWQPVSVGSGTQIAFDTADGSAWFATEFDLPRTAVPQSLYFGGVDDAADVWLNGQKVGTHEGHSEAFVFQASRFLKPSGNLLVVRVTDFGGPGGITKPVVLCDSTEVESLLRTKFSTMTARRSEAWVKNAVIYEVYLRSFSPEGTFRGLEQRLPELKKLGVTVVWLMPIHPIGQMGRKGRLGSPYSIEDYYGINSEFGTDEDFRSLVQATHREGLKIIIDLVANHTSWDSKLLLDHGAWFTHDDDGGIVSPNPDWTDVADLNYDQHELRKYMIEMMKHWVRDFDVDGYRCDVAELVPTDFWETARRELEKIKPVMMLAEGSLPEEHLSAFDLTYSWNLYDLFSNISKGTARATDFSRLLANESYQYPLHSLRLRFNTNHDKNAWDAPAVRKFGPQGAKATAVLAFTLPGVPLIYNGEEAGNERSLPLFEKVPIDWTRGSEFRQLYTQLGELRKRYPMLVDGNIEFLPAGSDHVVAFLRTDGVEKLLILANCSVDPQTLSVDCRGLGVSMKEYFSGTLVVIDGPSLRMNLGGFGYAVFVPGGQQ